MRCNSLLLALTVCGLAGTPSLAQSDWSKVYPAPAKPSVALEISDGDLHVRSCGECREVRIRVEWNGQKPENYRMEESQAGSNVHFLLKERPGIHMAFHQRSLVVTVDVPAELSLDAHTSDGRTTLADLRGDVSLQSGDGAVDVNNVEGNLRLRSNDGNVKVGNSRGALDARMSDGGFAADGVFHLLAVQINDGSLDLTLREGSRLTDPSTIKSSDGRVHLRLPRDLAADLDVHSNDGHVNFTVPISLNHYDSEKNGFRGKLNGGSVPLTIRSADGNISIEPL
jgi:Putative adhesin